MSRFDQRLLLIAWHLKRFLQARGTRSISGVAAIEFAIVVPFLILGFIGVADLGIGIYRDMEVRDAAQAGAQYAVLHGFNTATISAAVTSATPYSSISAEPGPIQFCGCATETGITTVTCGSLCSSGQTAATYVRVWASATYYPNLLYSSIFPSRFPMTAQSTVRIK